MEAPTEAPTEAPAEPVTAPPAAVGDGFGTTEGLFVGTASASSGRKLSAVSCTSAAARDCARKCPAGPAGTGCESCAPYELCLATRRAEANRRLIQRLKQQHTAKRVPAAAPPAWSRHAGGGRGLRGDDG